MTTTLRRSILAEVRRAARPVAMTTLTSGTYGSDRYSAVRSLIDSGDLVLSHGPSGSSYVEARNLVEAVKDHARANYERGGWDYVVERWSDDDIRRAITRTTTVAGSVKAVGEAVGVRADFRAEVIAAGGEDW